MKTKSPLRCFSARKWGRRFSWPPIAVAFLIGLRSVRSQSAGSLDLSFNPVLSDDSFVFAIAVQPDGKILLGGQFANVNGQPRNTIVRLLSDGTLEDTATFNAGAGPDDSVYSIALQADGKILIGGRFSTVNGQPRNNVARLLSDGTLEDSATFNAGTGPSGSVTSFAIQPDGKILMTGSFDTVNGQARSHLARISANGSLDSTFSSGLTSQISCIGLQEDGKILLGGSFPGGIPDFVPLGVIRLGDDAYLRMGMGPGSPSYSVSSTVVQTDGTVLLGGILNLLSAEASLG